MYNSSRFLYVSLTCDSYIYVELFNSSAGRLCSPGALKFWLFAEHCLIFLVLKRLHILFQFFLDSNCSMQFWYPRLFVMFYLLLFLDYIFFISIFFIKMSYQFVDYLLCSVYIVFYVTI